MARIVTVYTKWKTDFEPADMSFIRWLGISQALARLGHQVDIATNEFHMGLPKPPVILGPNIRRVPLSKVRWRDYDVVKTLKHQGFETLEAYRGLSHPFIISELGSVVGPKDMEGIYFYGEKRASLYRTQEKVHRTSQYIGLLNESAQKLWITCHGLRKNFLIVPAGVDREIPLPSEDPYPKEDSIRCLFAGTVYGQDSQPEANTVIIDKLNKLGQFLLSHGAHLYMIGRGDVRRLDPKYVTHLGVVPYERSWNYFHLAHVGVVVTAGPFLHNNESSKLYYYLRAGLPVVSEVGFPNDHVVAESGLGYVVENGNLELMARRIQEAAEKNWDREFAIQYILNNHTWDKRAEIYDRVIKDACVQRKDGIRRFFSIFGA